MKRYRAIVQRHHCLPRLWWEIDKNNKSKWKFKWRKAVLSFQDLLTALSLFNISDFEVKTEPLIFNKLKRCRPRVWALIKRVKGSMTVCDSLVSSKLGGFVLEHLLNSLSFSRMIPFAQMQIRGHICWGKNVLIEPFADYISTCARTWCTCCFWCQLFLTPRLLGLCRKYSGGQGEAIAFFCKGAFCLHEQAKGRSSVTNLYLL